MPEMEKGEHVWFPAVYSVTILASRAIIFFPHSTRCIAFQSLRFQICPQIPEPSQPLQTPNPLPAPKWSDLDAFLHPHRLADSLVFPGQSDASHARNFILDPIKLTAVAAKKALEYLLRDACGIHLAALESLDQSLHNQLARVRLGVGARGRFLGLLGRDGMGGRVGTEEELTVRGEKGGD